MVETQTRLDQALQENQHRTSDPVKTLAKNGYIVGDIIGSGSFAIVKKAYWTKLRSTVAIKIMSKAQASDQTMLKYVPRELDIIRTLRHEHIIHFYEIIETNMRIYIVMQYGEKGPILNLVRKANKLPEWRVRRYYQQLIDAIYYLHSRGIAHRDIKLENIVLDAKDQLKLIDFGFACQVRHEHNDPSRYVESYKSESFCGSYAYASPEILQFKPYDPIPTDIWASGVVLYSLLFGQLPFSNVRKAPVMLEIIAKGVQFRSKLTVTDEVKMLLKQIFVPVARRLNASLIKHSLWFHIELAEESEENTITIERKKSKTSRESYPNIPAP